MTPIRVVLADDHALVRAGIRSLLTAITGVEVVAEAGDGYEVVQLVDSLQPRLRPWTSPCPVSTGLEARRASSRANPRTAVIILSMHATSSTHSRRSAREPPDIS